MRQTSYAHAAGQFTDSRRPPKSVVQCNFLVAQSHVASWFVKQDVPLLVLVQESCFFDGRHGTFDRLQSDRLVGSRLTR